MYVTKDWVRFNLQSLQQLIQKEQDSGVIDMSVIKAYIQTMLDSVK